MKKVSWLFFYLIFTQAIVNVASAQDGTSTWEPLSPSNMRITGACYKNFKNLTQKKSLRRASTCTVEVKNPYIGQITKIVVCLHNLRQKALPTYTNENPCGQNGRISGSQQIAVSTLTTDKTKFKFKITKEMIKRKIKYMVFGFAKKPEPTTNNNNLPVDSCESYIKNFDLELSRVQSCTQNSDCGQIIPNLTCGCTRSLVANNNANLENLNNLVKLIKARQECADLFPYTVSLCDCPNAKVICKDGKCGWNYAGGGKL